VAEVVEDPAQPGMFTATVEMAAAGPAGAAAEVYWTNWPTYQDPPFPTVALGNRRWRMRSLEPDHTRHLRAPGESFGNLAVRYALEAGGPISGNSLDRKSWTVPEPSESVEGDWRQVVDRLQSERAAPPDQPELWSTAVYGGEGLQWFHGHGRGVSNPDRVVSGQDMGSVRASANGGRFWYAPPNVGLQIIGVEAMLVDPVDADVVYTLATTYFDKDYAWDGVYKSTDFCRTWALVKNIPQLQPFNRYAKKTICRWPVETGAASDASIRLGSSLAALARRLTKVSGGPRTAARPGPAC
jgi:hypothetical protein